ncbi:hypothetical protein ISS07_04890 [Candidatus Woesearchaeota archaeon]|nr:hypothetical protein [Candidatus Woesearchaeota archaeon]
MKIEGEGKLLLEQLKEISSAMLEGLTELDNKIYNLQEEIKKESEFSKESIISRLQDLRNSVVSIEKKDNEELEEEQILENMIKKLDELIQLTFG